MEENHPAASIEEKESPLYYSYPPIQIILLRVLNTTFEDNKNDWYLELKLVNYRKFI